MQSYKTRYIALGLCEVGPPSKQGIGSTTTTTKLYQHRHVKGKQPKLYTFN